MATHITIGYIKGIPKVLYVGGSVAESTQAYECDTECDSYELLRHCRGYRKTAKRLPVNSPVTQVQEQEPETDTASPEPRRRGRPPKLE